MNQGRIWCVVNPTVGLPLLIGSVAVTSLIVHYAVLSHTTWMSGYWQGAAKSKVAMETKTPQVAAVTPQSGSAPYVVTVAPVAATAGKAEASFVVTVAPTPGPTVAVGSARDGTAAKPPGQLALASPARN